MTTFLSPITSAIGSATTAFLNLSPWGQAATVTAVALPIIYKYGFQSKPFHIITMEEPQPQRQPVVGAPNQAPTNIGVVHGQPVAPVPAPVIVHTWNLEGRQVNLLRVRNALEYQVIGQGRNFRGPIPIPRHLAIEDCIGNLKRLRPEIQANDSVIFKKITRFRSELSDNEDDYVDLNTWAVRLVDTGRSQVGSDIFSPLSAGGHAVILIEGVTERGYFIWRADLVSNPRMGKGFVRSKEATDDFHWIKANITSLSPFAWLKPREQVQKMLQAIEGEKSAQGPRGINSKIVYSTCGFDQTSWNPISYVALYGRNLFTGNSIFEMPQNCMSWAKQKLDLIGIDFLPWYDPRMLMTADYLFAPKQYMDPAYLHTSFIQRSTTNPFLITT